MADQFSVTRDVPMQGRRIMDDRPWESTPSYFWSLMGDPGSRERYAQRPYGLLEYAMATGGGVPNPEQLRYMYGAMFGGPPSTLQQIQLLMGGGPPGTSALDRGSNLLSQLLWNLGR